VQTRGSTPLLTLAELKRVIEVLPPAAWLRLHRVARALCRHAGIEADDLLQEAFQRALDGSRQCPRHVDVVRFLAASMRSISSDWSKARKRRNDLGFLASAAAVQKATLQVRDLQPGPHELLAGEQEATRMMNAILALFADDLVAQRMLDGIMQGLSGAELRGLCGLTETEFASKRRLVRRRIDKAFPKDLKP